LPSAELPPTTARTGKAGVTVHRAITATTPDSALQRLSFGRLTHSGYDR